MKPIDFGQKIDNLRKVTQKSINDKNFSELTPEEIWNNLSELDLSMQSKLFEQPCAKDRGFKLIMSIELLARLSIRALLPELKGNIELIKIDPETFTEPLNALDDSMQLNTAPTIIPDISYLVSTDSEITIGKRRNTAVMINLEMQGSYRLGYNLKDRIMYYIARHLTSSLANKARYEELNDVYSIWFVQDILYQDEIPMRQVVMTEHLPTGDFGCCLYKAPNNETDISRDGKPYEYLIHAIIIELPKAVPLINKVLTNNSTVARRRKNFSNILFASILKSFVNNEYTLAELFNSLNKEINKYRSNIQEYEELTDNYLIAGGNIMDKINETYEEFESSYDKMMTNYDKMATSYDKMVTNYDRISAENEKISAENEKISAELLQTKKQLVLICYNNNMDTYKIAELAGLTVEQVNEIINKF